MGVCYLIQEVVLVKYFVIHSGRDFDSVKLLIDRLSQISDNIQFVILEGNQLNWEGDAIARIRECAKVLYVVGETSAKSPYIQIELDITSRENKELYVYKLDENYLVNDCLLKSNFTKKGDFEGEIVIAKSKNRVYFLNEVELMNQLHADSQEIGMILKGSSFDDKDTLMEQYKMFVQTSEDLVSRKQSVNTFYVTLNSIMLSAIISIICAAGDILLIAENSIVIYIISGFLAVIGVVICSSWITLLISYADLNASKMAIISCIEEKLALKLFDAEWALLTRRIGKRKYQSFTVKELAVARIFLILYLVLVVVCMILCGISLVR